MAHALTRVGAITARLGIHPPAQRISVLPNLAPDSSLKACTNFASSISMWLAHVQAIGLPLDRNHFGLPSAVQRLRAAAILVYQDGCFELNDCDVGRSTVDVRAARIGVLNRPPSHSSTLQFRLSPLLVEVTDLESDWGIEAVNEFSGSICAV